MSAEIQDGAFIVARAIFNSSIWTMRKDEKILAITLIGLANWKERKWFDGKGERSIKRGQLVRSVRRLADEAGLSYQETRTSLRNLSKVGFLTQETTQHYTIITLIKYDKYQDLTRYCDLEWPQELTQNLTNDQRTLNERLTNDQRTPNDKQERNKEIKKEEEKRDSLPKNETTGTAEQEIVRRFIQIATLTAKCPSKLDTIRQHLTALVARSDVGAAKLEKYLMSSEALGRTVNHWHEHFDAKSLNGKQNNTIKEHFPKVRKLYEE